METYGGFPFNEYVIEHPSSITNIPHNTSAPAHPLTELPSNQPTNRPGIAAGVKADNDIRQSATLISPI